MQDRPDIEALKVELADKKAILADLESGKFPSGLGQPFEDREAALRRKIAEIESLLRGHETPRS